MPHDRKDQELAVGDTVLVPVRGVQDVQVESNPDHPGEYAPRLSLPDQGAQRYVRAEVIELYEDEDACNAEFDFGHGVQATFNTRLVEKIES